MVPAEPNVRYQASRLGDHWDWFIYSHKCNWKDAWVYNFIRRQNIYIFTFLWDKGKLIYVKHFIIRLKSLHKTCLIYEYSKNTDSILSSRHLWLIPCARLSIGRNRYPLVDVEWQYYWLPARNKCPLITSTLPQWRRGPVLPFQSAAWSGNVIQDFVCQISMHKRQTWFTSKHRVMPLTCSKRNTLDHICKSMSQSTGTKQL